MPVILKTLKVFVETAARQEYEIFDDRSRVKTDKLFVSWIY